MMDINKNAPVYESDNIKIEAPIEVVWKLISDLHEWPKWNKSVSYVDVSGEVEPGTCFFWIAGGAEIRSRLEEVSPPGRIVWSGITKGISAIHVWQLTSQNGGTVVYTEESFQGFIALLLPWVLRKMLKNALSQGLLALKEEAERQFQVI